jgi:molybdopterin/thiamine biosynthesis adenylyltransferase
MGLTNVTVQDADTIETHNISNQFYPLLSVGKSKVSTLIDVIANFSGVVIKTIKKRFQGEELTENFVISAVDSLEARKTIWDAVKTDKKVKYYIDTRMGGKLMRIYVVDKTNKKDVRDYELVLSKPAPLVPIKCTEKTIIFNVMIIAGLTACLVSKILNKTDLPFESVFDLENLIFMKG